MNRCFSHEHVRLLIFLLFFTLIHWSAAASTTFVAVTSGSWSSAITWGGTAPPHEITAADQIIINAGVSVVMDGDVTLDNPLAVLTVLGHLDGENFNIVVSSGTLAGSGTLTVKDLVIEGGGGFVFTGDASCSVFANHNSLLNLKARLDIESTMKLMNGQCVLDPGSVITLDSNATCLIDGGEILLNGGNINVLGRYNLTYVGTSRSTGVETDLGEIGVLTVFLLDSTQTLTLSKNLTVHDSTKILAGGLKLNEKQITFYKSVDFGPLGYFVGDTLCGIQFSSNDSSTLKFHANSAVLASLHVTGNDSCSVTLGSNLQVEDSLFVNSGSVVLNGQELTLNGAVDFGGQGSLTGDANAVVVLNGSGSVSLQFTPGSEQLGGCVVNLGSGELTLNSDLAIENNLQVQSGAVVLNGNELTLNGAVDFGGQGSLTGDANAVVVLNGNGSVSLQFTPGSEQLGGCVVNLGSGELTLNSDLAIENNLQVQSGAVVLNGNELTLNGAVDFGGQGSLTGDANAVVVLNGNGSVSLQFTPGSEQLGGCVVNLGSGELTLNSDLAIENNLQVQSGAVVLNGNELTLNGAVDFGGQGSLTGDANAVVVLNGNGSVSLQFTPGSEQLGGCVVNLGSGELTLNSDLAIENNLQVQSGAVVLNGQELTLNGAVDFGGQGSLTGDANAVVVLNGNGSVSLQFTPGSEQLGGCVVNLGSGELTQNSELQIHQKLELITGLLILVDEHLVLKDGAAIDGGSAEAYVVTKGEGRLVIGVSPGDEAFFPVGTIEDYGPCVIQQGPDAEKLQLAVGVIQGVYSEGTTGIDLSTSERVVKHSWLIDEVSGSNNLDLTLEFFWQGDAAVNGFDPDFCYISHFVNGAWDTIAASSATLHIDGSYSIQRKGIQSLSPFRVISDMSTQANDVYKPAPKLFPNPVSTVLNLQVQPQPKPAFIRIYNEWGHLVLTEALPAGSPTSSIDTNILPNGIYWLIVQDHKPVKFIKMNEE